MSLLLNMLSRLVITFLPRSKRLLISWLQSPSAVISEPKKIKSDIVSTVSLSISHEVMGLDAMIFVFWMLNFKPTFFLQIWKTQQWPQDWKRSVFIPIPKKVNAKECSNYCTIALISHARKEMLKILWARLQWYVNCELPGVQAGFRKGRGTRDQIANIRWIIENAREFQKNIYFCFIDYSKAFDCVDHNKLWKFFCYM